MNTGHDVRPLRILSVEDNPHDVRFARMALDDSGCVYELTHVENGETAWLYLSDPNMTPPDLVILDLHLPDELNGFDILERIAMLSRRPEVIMLTGSTRREKDRARALALGARHYHEKPILCEQWERIAEDICAIRDDRHRGGGHPPTPATPPYVRVRIRRFEMVTPPLPRTMTEARAI